LFHEVFFPHSVVSVIRPSFAEQDARRHFEIEFAKLLNKIGAHQLKSMEQRPENKHSNKLRKTVFQPDIF
jgi:hypothetical protein